MSYFYVFVQKLRKVNLSGQVDKIFLILLNYSDTNQRFVQKFTSICK